MALSEEQLEILGDVLTPLFQHLESEIIADVARRIDKTLSYTRTAELQAIAMKELGYSPNKIRSESMKLLNADSEYRKIVAKNTLEYKRKVQKIISDIVKKAVKENDDVVMNAGDMAWVNDLSVWKSSGKELTNSSFLTQLVESFQRQTKGELKNLTNSAGFKTKSGYENIHDTYQRELDKAMIKITSGSFSRDVVLRDVVKELANSGLRSVNYASGKSMLLDTAAALTLRTGCHQLAGKVTDKNLEQSGENLVYVSKHWGARNTGIGHANHEQWQGKVYFIKDGEDYADEAKRIGINDIKSLWRETGYSVDGSQENDPLGLNGYNCRHNLFPWFVGASSLPNESPEPQPVTINGKTYDYYAMTQEMRRREREIRALKREKETVTKFGIADGEIDVKLKRKSREYKLFCAKCGIRPKNNRLRYQANTSDLTKTEAYKDYQRALER